MLSRVHALARRHLKESGVPVETSKGEWGNGQHELNVRYAEALDMADRHVIFKQCLKEIAELSGMSLTFMAKPDASQAGSSCHIHFSLWKDGKNAFADPSSSDGLSTTAKQYIAGVLKYAQECCSFWAPTVNSYKRLVPGYEAPVYIAWSLRNRSALIRVPAFTPGREKSVRMHAIGSPVYLFKVNYLPLLIEALLVFIYWDKLARAIPEIVEGKVLA